MLPGSQCPILSYSSNLYHCLENYIYSIGFALIELRGMKKDEIKLNLLQLCAPVALTWKKKGLEKVKGLLSRSNY